MIELKDGINYHNFLLDTKPKIFFNRQKGETDEVIERLSKMF
jgi:hypothetical protein